MKICVSRFIAGILVGLLVLEKPSCAATTRSADGKDEEEEETYTVSKTCASLLVMGGLGAGALATNAAPLVLCTAGFCPVGVTAGSFASWWQSTMPLVKAGGTFAKLQSFSMGGSSLTGFTITSSLVGGASSLYYLKEFCAVVDEHAETAEEAFHNAVIDIESKCRASESCSYYKHQGSVMANQFGEFVTDTGGKVVETVKDLHEQCLNSESCNRFKEQMVETVKDTGEKVVETVKDTKEQLVETVKDLHEQCLNSEFCSQFKAQATEMPEKAANYLSSAMNQFMSYLQDTNEGTHDKDNAGDVEKMPIS